jgi:hypothetical protein
MLHKTMREFQDKSPDTTAKSLESMRFLRGLGAIEIRSARDTTKSKARTPPLINTNLFDAQIISSASLFEKASITKSD